jgi:hypothetical protein
MFKYLQTEVIETNIRAYGSGRTRAEDFKIKKLKCLFADYFRKKYELKKLSESDEVDGKVKQKKRWPSTWIHGLKRVLLQMD